jgi:hypothetical protein
MSAERPGAEVPEQPPADGPVPAEPEVAVPADAEPTLPQHTVEPTRTSMVWTMVGIGVVLLVAFLVFILQNGQRVRVRFLMVDGTLPLWVWGCCLRRCWARCWCWWRVRRGCCSCGWWHDAIAAPTSCPKRSEVPPSPPYVRETQAGTPGPPSGSGRSAPARSSTRCSSGDPTGPAGADATDPHPT